MTDRYDPLPDIADLLAASVHENAIPPAVRLAKRLRVTPESGAKLIEARICEALALMIADQPMDLTARVTSILTAAGYTDARDSFPGGFLVTDGTGIVIVTVPWSDATDGERKRLLARLAAELRDGGLDVTARRHYLQVSTAEIGVGQ
jgi:hypothetical protein